jgi:hypothetical protein
MELTNYDKQHLLDLVKKLLKNELSEFITFERLPELLQLLYGPIY